MKTSISLIVLSLGLLAFDTNAANTNFNHQGVQNGAISESCYHDPCAVTRIMKSEIVKKKPGYTQLKLKAVSGYKG